MTYRLTHAERAARKRRIMLVYRRGYNTAEVAKVFGLSRNYVWRIVRQADIHRKGDVRPRRARV